MIKNRRWILSSKLPMAFSTYGILNPGSDREGNNQLRGTWEVLGAEKKD